MQTTFVHNLEHRLSTCGGLLAIILWSTNLALARSLSEQIGSVTAGTAVFLVAGIFCLMRLAWRGAPMRHLSALSMKYLVVCGFLFVAYEALLFLAVGLARDRQQLLEVALVNYLWPAGTLLLSVPLLNKRFTFMLLPGTGLALLGVFLTLSSGSGSLGISFIRNLQSNPVAYGAAFIAAAFWALYSNLTRRWTTSDKNGAIDVFIPLTGLVMLCIRSLWRPELTSWSVHAAIEATVLGSITAAAYVLWERGMRKGEVTLLGACSYFTPLLSTVMSCAYLRVMPGLELWIGAILIVVGALASWHSVSIHKTYRAAHSDFI